MNFVQAIANCFYKFGTFAGRASRAEFWWFFLLQFATWVSASLLVEQIEGEFVGALLGLLVMALYLPGLAVGSRRLHDIGRSGWWQLLMLTGIGYLWLIYWWVQLADGPNAYGDVADAA